MWFANHSLGSRFQSVCLISVPGRPRTALKDAFYARVE